MKTSDFLKLILSSFDHESSSDERAREYLQSENLDPDEILMSGLGRIEKIKEKISSKKLQYNKTWKHPSILRFIKETGNPDPISEIKERARNTVLKAFEFGWEGPPYSPIQLAQYLGIEVIPNDSVVDARILPNQTSFQIQYNPFQRPTRKNFSVAHEIAHTFFSDCAERVRNREESPSENRELEQLCNTAAAEIQLPYAIFSNDTKGVDPSIDGLLELAGRYKASLESVFLRYVDVVNKKCIMIVGIFESDSRITVSYSKASRNSNIRIPSDFIIPDNSKAYECISPGWSARENVNWNFLDEEYQMSAVGISPYRRDNKPRLGMLLFPREKAKDSTESGKIILEYGDATKPRGKGKKIIAQVVNTSGTLGRGFGYSLSKNYAVVAQKLKEWKSSKANFKLGTSNLISVDTGLWVFQMLAQKGLFTVNNEIPLKYEHLRECLIDLRKAASELNASVHMPAIGAGQAKGDWNIIIGMIHDELVNFGVKVNIYLLPGAPFNPKHKSNLTIFKEDSTWENGKLF